MQVSPDQLSKLEQTLLSQAEPLHNRFRALFTLKAVGGSDAIRIVAEGASAWLWLASCAEEETRADPCELPSVDAAPPSRPGFKDPSALLKHEFAYVLGQLRLTEACPILSGVLENQEEDPMVRHEVRRLLAGSPWRPPLAGAQLDSGGTLRAY